MTLTNFPNGVSSYGVPIVGSGQLPQSNGGYWFVNSVTGLNGNPGTFDAPFATLAYALSQSQLAVGDTIVLLEGHSETVSAAAGILAATAGVNIFGFGLGAGAPTLTFATSTAATLRITGANVSIQGLRFVNGVASLATMLDIKGVNANVVGNAFVQGASTTGLSFIDFAGVAANAADGAKILGNTFYAPAAGNYNHAIGLNTVQDNVEIAGNYIYGNFALSGIHNVTGQVATNVNVHDNYVKNLTAAKPALNFVSAVTGVAYRNVFEAGDGTVNAAKFNTAIDASGNNRANNGNLDAGQEFWVSKTGVVSSTITQVGVDMTVASIGGPIAIKDVILKTNATGLAGMTNFTMTVNNANGASVFLSQAAAGLGANATVQLSAAGTTKSETVIETGKKITLKATVADGTGAGTIDIHMLCQRMTAGADISVA